MVVRNSGSLNLIFALAFFAIPLAAKSNGLVEKKFYCGSLANVEVEVEPGKDGAVFIIEHCYCGENAEAMKKLLKLHCEEAVRASSEGSYSPPPRHSSSLLGTGLFSGPSDDEIKAMSIPFRSLLSERSGIYPYTEELHLGQQDHVEKTIYCYSRDTISNYAQRCGQAGRALKETSR